MAVSTEERRIVTVLFADMAGSTALGEELDPEEMRRLLARYYAIARESVEQHGGTVEKFIGDAVMAVFGLPTAHGDDPDRAVAAALMMRDRIRADALLADRVAIRFGVSTGEVVASRDQSAGDFLITGDATNVAARLQQEAEPWAILASDRTVRAPNTVEFGEEVEVRARGKSAPVPARQVIGPKKAKATRRVRLPLMGRENDLAQLQLVARRAVSERRPALVSVIAPAGVGKTRLVEEFMSWLPSLAPDAIVATAQCLPYGQQLTYWPMRQVIFTLTNTTEDTPPSQVREAIGTWLRDVGVENADRDARLLAATIGEAGTEGVDKDLLFAAWRSAIEATARRHPLVIVFEDLHWSSDSLLDLAQFVMQPRGDAAVLMIVLARPELLDRRPNWGGGKLNHLAIALEPLAPNAIGDLVRHLLDSDAPDVVKLVAERAEGNPFYAGELVRSYLEHGSLERLPDTVQGTVLARLDLLPPEERRVLQLGSVFGRAFRAAGVAALELGEAPQVVALCENLVDRDLIRPTESDRFAFRHILIQEVAYGTLPRTERARLHAAAARWGESTAGERGLEEYRLALEQYEAVNAPVEDQLRALAGMLMVSTRWAGSVGDRPSEEWMADLRARGRRLLKRANDRYSIGRFLAADAFFPFWIQGIREPTPQELVLSKASADRAIEIATELDDPDLLSTALDATTGVSQATNDWAGGLESARRRIAFEERLGLYERLDAHSMVAWMTYLMRDLATAEKDSGEMAARLLPGQAPYPALHLFAWRSLTLMMLGRWDEAVAVFYRALEAWNEAGRHAAGYGFRGFVAGLDIGRARGDARLVDAATEAMESILARYPTSHQNQTLHQYIRGESGLTANDPMLVSQPPWEGAERRVSLACDRREQLPREILEPGLARAQQVGVPLLEAQIRRARGLAYRDASELSLAIAAWERMGAVPPLGRARAERGLINGDVAETEAGLAMLKKLGDVEYVDRF